MDEEVPAATVEEKHGTEELWDEIGFHKTLGGFWFNIVYIVVGIGLSSFLMGALLNYFYPFPESLGYRDVAYGVFGLIFVAFDLGTGAVMGRFVAESNIREPEKLLHYVQYFIWYQFITGLIQISLLSAYALYYVPDTSLSYTSWIMLIAASTQYPGFLGVFRNVLGSLQHYNKTATLNFFTGTLFQRLTELLFVYLGRLYGEANPAVGPILGIAIGSAIGLYVDDFFATLVSAYFFSKVMRDYGVRARDCLKVDFTWREVKPVLVYSVKTGIPGILGSSLSLVNLWLWISYVPQYTTLTTLAMIGGSIADVMYWFSVPSMTPLVAESYLNGKQRLTQYYIGQKIRFHAFLQGFFVPLIVLLMSVMPIAWTTFGMVNYMAGIAFIIPRMLGTLINPYAGIPGEVMYGANKPNFGVFLGITSNIANTVLLFFYLAVWQFPLRYGITAVVWIITCGGFPIAVVIMVAGYLYVQKRIVPVKVPWSQVLVGVVVPAAITYGAMYLLLVGLFYPVLSASNFYVAAIVSVPFFFLFLIFLYVPLSGYFGGWDDTNLDEFKKAAEMSGPSKFIVSPCYKALNWACSKSPMHNRFAMPIEGVVEDAHDLLETKRRSRAKFREKMEKLREEPVES
ncbi:MAG: hypothetical protein ACTSU5_11260 [Promethearchaeota archaeon]